MKTTSTAVLLTLLTLQAFSQSLNLLDSSAKRKVDPLLQQSILAKERFPDQAVTAIEFHAAGTRAAKEMGDMVGVLIESSADITQYVRSLGGTVGSRHGNIYTALVPATTVGQVAQQRSVAYIEASRTLHPSLDLSLAKTGADVLHAMSDSSKRLTGKGVIVGFTDTGINTLNPNFRTADGRTRILYVWDQYSFGTPPAGFTYGVERDSSAINAGIWSMDDYDAHGTHVAGIATGNGLPDKEYVGMAPDADIIMVSNRGDDLFNRGLTTVGTLDGYDYIRAKANALGRRFVVNTSQGTNLGPHDGTTLFEKAINADVAAGGILALAAGNEATSSRHASAIVTTASPQEIECDILSSGFSAPMDIWYETNDRLILRIKESDDSSYVALFPAVDSTIVYAFDWAVVTVTTKIGSPLNGDNEIYITFRAFSPVSMMLEFSVAPGNNLPDGGRVDLWWERNYPVQFVSHVDKSMTFGIPAGADSAITVASYNNRKGYGAVEDISSFSGKGPRRDGVLKPDIAGLGGMVTSSIYSSEFATFSGTSMSSPHVAGAVALLLQQDSSLTSYEVKQKLLTSASSDLFTGPVPNPTWGYGKLNVFKAAGYRGIPIIELATDTLEMGSVLVQAVNRDSVIIRNPGNDDLTIISVTPSSGMFSAENPSFVIGPRGMGYLYVNVTPTDTGAFAGYLDIASDDSANLIVRIALLGRGDYAPIAGTSPDSMHVTLDEGEHAAPTLTIANAGQGPLRYSITVDDAVETVAGRRVPGQSPSLTWNPPVERSSLSSSTVPQFGVTPLLPIIVKDPIGDGSGVDISEIRGIVDSGMVKLQIVLATEFDSYDFGGYLGLDVDQNVATGIPLPNGESAQDVGCEFFLTLFNLSSGVLLYDSTGNLRGIFAPVLNTAGKSFSFSIPLEALGGDDGTINIAGVFGTSGSPTDWVPDVGHGTMRVSWLSAAPSEGVIPAGSSFPVAVLINTDNLGSGSFFSRLVINTNDPNKKKIEISVRADVAGAANLLVADSINFGTVYVESPDTMDVPHLPAQGVDLVITNNGSFDLTVTSMTINNSQFGLLGATSFTLGRDQKRTIRITCNPSAPGNLSAQLSIESNDAGSPSLAIPITAIAAQPPLITLSPDSLSATVGEGDTVSATLTIRNAGLGELRWAIKDAEGDSLPLTAARTESDRLAVQFQQREQKGNNNGTATVGQFPMRALLSADGTKSILLWTGYADVNPGGEVENTMNAIMQFAPDVAFTMTQTHDVAEFTALLEASDLFILPEQERTGDLFSLGGAFGPALSSFVQSGRTFIVMDYFYTGSTSFLAGTGLLDITLVGGGEFTAVIHDSTSPLVKGLPGTFYAMNGSYHHMSSLGRKILMEQVTENNVVTLRDFDAGRIIYIGMDFYSYNDDMARLLANAVVSSHGRIVSVSPSSGVVPAGGSQDVTVAFDATRLRARAYRSRIPISNNDPLHNPKVLTATVNVTAKPLITFSPDSLVGIVAPVGVPRVDTLWVGNAGSLVLSVSSVVTNDTTVAVTNSAFSVGAESRYPLLITRTAVDTGAFRSHITFTNNDTRNPAATFVVAGIAVFSPVLTTTPDSFLVVIDEGETLTRVLTIGNTGLGDLQWEIPGVPASGVIADGIQQGTQLLSNDWIRDYAVLSSSTKSGKAVRISPRNPLFTGAAQVSDISVAVFGDENVSNITSFLLAHSYSATTVSASAILGGQLENYDVLVMVHHIHALAPGVKEAIESFVRRGGGLVTEWSSSTLLFSGVGPSPFLAQTPQWSWYFGVVDRGDYVATNTPIDILDSGDPLVAHLSDPFSGSTSTEYFYTVSGYSAQLQVAAQYTGHGGTWPALMKGSYGAGSVVIHLFDSADDPTQPSIQQLWFNSIKVAGEGSGWVSADKRAGDLQPGESTGVALTFNAENIPGGQYERSISINNNDPLRNPKNIPVTFNVTGKPFIEFLPDSIVGAITYKDVPRTDSIVVRNAGSAVLSVSNVAASDTTFKVNKSSFTVAGDTMTVLAITTTMRDTGRFRGVITFASNDPKNPTATFVLDGTSLNRPVLTITPDSLSFTMGENGSVSQNLTIRNDGLAVLNWEYGTSTGASAVHANRIESLFASRSSWRRWAEESEPAPSAVPSPYGMQKSSPHLSPTAAIVEGTPFFPLYGTTSSGIREIDPRTGAVMREIAMSLSAGPDGIAFDGASLYVLPGYSSVIYVVSPVTGMKTDSIFIPSSTVDGLATDGTLLYILDYNLSQIYAVSIATKAVVATLKPPVIIGGGITYSGSRNTLFVSNFGSGIFEIDATTGAMIRSFSSPNAVNVYGVAYSTSADLLIVSGGGATFLLDPNSGEVRGSFEGMYSGLTADEAINALFSLDPHSGSLNPDNSQQVAVRASVKDLPPGDYRYLLTLKSNDPLARTKATPVALHVSGRPVIAVSPDTIRFGAYVGVTRKDTILVKNTGSVMLEVGAVTPSDQMFKPDTSSFTLAAHAQRKLVVSHTPVDTGAFSGSITIASNDTSMPAVTVWLYGVAALPPILSVTPDSLIFTLEEVDSLVSTMTINNTGPGELVWEIPGASATSLADARPASRTDEERATILQQQADRKGNNEGVPSVGPFSMNAMLSATSGNTHVLLWTGFADTSAGGEAENIMNAIRQYRPDVTFERTSTNNPVEFAGRLGAADIFIMPEQEWIFDLTSLGTSFAPALAAFVQTGKTMIVLDNYSTGSTTFLNATGLLSISIISNGQFMVAVEDSASPLVKDMPRNFVGMDGTNYHSSTNGRRIARREGSDFHVVTQRDVGAGRVIYVGMDYYSYNSSMARLLANAVTSSRGSFVTFFPSSGVIGPGGSQEVAVRFNAKNLPTGRYVTTITIFNNDPLRSRKDIPVKLTRVLTGVDGEEPPIPTVFALHQNYPNPFNPTTRIQYDLPKRSPVTMEVYNILGERLMVLVDEDQPAGYHSVVWNATTGNGAASSGVYLVRIQASEFVKTIKTVLVR